MALHKEQREFDTTIHQQGGEPLARKVMKDVLVYDLICDCGKKGGEVVFPLAHGRADDDALESELKAMYSHACDEHNTK